MIRRHHPRPFSVLLAGLFACALGVGLRPATAQATDLEAAVERLVGGSRLAADRVGVCVLDARTGERVAAHRPEAAMMPASTLKVATTGAALLRLGPEHELETRLLAVPPAAGGDPSEVAGDAWLVGGGDPGFSEHGPEGGTLAALDAFAGQVAGRGVRTIRGDLVVDTSGFDGPRTHASWTDVGPSARWWAAEVDALTANDGCIDVTVEPGASPGAAGHIALHPANGLVHLENRVVTTAAKKEHGFRFHLAAERNDLRVSGKVWTRSSGATLPAAVRDPGLFCGDLVGRALARAGICIEGVVRRRRPEETLPAGAALLARHVTTLGAACAVANTRSQNLWAETILRVLGQERHGEGSFAAGARAVRGVLHPAGESIGRGLHPVDGSGLSRDNRVTPEAMARVLAHLWRSEVRDAFFDGLARPGRGTLDDRFGDARFADRVFAKTGTLSGVSGLCGLALGPGDRPLVFCILGEHVSVGRARALQDAIVGVLVGPPEKSR